jgi:hypothetical protein
MRKKYIISVDTLDHGDAGAHIRVYGHRSGEKDTAMLEVQEIVSRDMINKYQPPEDAVRTPEERCLREIVSALHYKSYGK